jgi:uncharacterized protein YdhG (YjbR/CyaY superfamily)
MQSRAKTVTEYMKEVPSDQLDVLTEFREICLRNLPGFRESMEFGMPSYSRDSQIEVAWQSQKNEIILMVKNEELLKSFRPQLKGMELGKNHVHFKKPDHIDFALITTLIRQVADSRQGVTA